MYRMLQYISFDLLSNLFSVYLFSIDSLTKILNKTRKSITYTTNSFVSETLYFFPDSSVPLIATPENNVLFNPSLEGPYWIFSENTFRFSSETNKPPSKLPYISASLFKNGVFVSDLSEWIQNVVMVSSESLPLRVLVMTWAYSTGTVLEGYRTSEYTMQVFTTDGEEHMLNIKTA